MEPMDPIEPSVKLTGYMGGFHVDVSGDATAFVDLSYPNYDLEKAGAVQVGLSAVRAADDLKVKYDFDRDGWVVYQQMGVEHHSFATTEEGWHEVGFFGAWAGYKECPHYADDCPECPMEDDGS